MKTPSNSTKITKPWLEFILQDYVGKKQPGTSVVVLAFAVSQGIPPGEGFNSELVLVDVKAKVSKQYSHDGFEETTYHLAAKFPHTNPMSAEINRKFQSHSKEYIIYSTAVTELNNFQAATAPDDPRILIPEIVYGKDKGSEYVLVMENLKAAGFATNDKRKGLDFEHTMEAVLQLARVHAVSYAYDKSHKFLEKFPIFELTGFATKGLQSLLLASIGAGVEYLKTLEGKEELAQKIDHAKNKLLENFEEVIVNQGDIRCLCHGDFWNSNIMYKHLESGGADQCRIEDIRMIDWGNSIWGNPILDLHYLLSTSTTAGMRKTNLEEILQAYHALFISITAKLGAPLPHWDYNTFRREWDRTAVSGFVLGVTLILSTLSTSNPANKAAEPSVLDHSALTPVRFVVRGFQTGMAKLMFPLMTMSGTSKIMDIFVGMFFKPVFKELLSGTNLVMNTRLLELLCEADEKGLFDI